MSVVLTGMGDTSGPQGDSELLSRWVHEHSRAVRGFLLGLVRRHDVADDLLQEVFQRAWQARASYQERGRERSYLLKIADRLVCDRSRRLGIEVTVDETAWEQLEPAGDEHSPLDELAGRDTSRELAAGLDRLTQAQKRVLLMRYYSDLEFTEIARQMEIPLNTALSHARRGLLALKKVLTESLAEKLP
jgi:RNA polymerase sigma-70 factor (ECF subfamily)